MGLLWMRLAALMFVMGAAQAWADCRIPAAPGWSENEKEAWRQICNGSWISAKDWGKDRTLGSDFIKSVLSNPYKGALKPGGINIDGAVFREALDLDRMTVETKLAFTNCVFENTLNLIEADIR